MTAPKFEIPTEFASQLRYVETKDPRTDDAILKELNTSVPITSEKNVWTYWHSGISNMPNWCKRNIINWVRLHDDTWTIRVLDTVPGSPNHALKWIDAKELPEAFVEGTMTGPWTGPHSADFLRGAALYRYGGVWTDVGTILFRDFDRVCWNQLADEECPYNVAVPWMFQQYMANHFVAARKGDEFIKRWHDLFMYFWRGRTDYKGITDSPLIAFVHNIRFAAAQERGMSWNWKVDELTALGYVGQVMAWTRLSWLKEPNGFDGVAYSQNNVLWFDVLKEDWAAEPIVGWEGKGLFNVLTTRLDADPESEEYKKAYACTWRLLTDSTMEKITHAKNLTIDLACGALLDLPENEGKDAAPGTFGELLRYGSVHFEQTRERIAQVELEEVKSEFVLHEPLFGWPN
ncbi:capsule polysaccharide biosynthesis protein [Lophiotrema nucula]|uniref:Capsule polysaccharide biosynthesis protein n=1 Tax=Lophiotrema nucula TaxID=690887 RepID=A0A6A5YSX9_9PLEO|nr:capsule polysaccharide biosynthesis protein [Lophiotrema nucula]